MRAFLRALAALAITALFIGGGPAFAAPSTIVVQSDGITPDGHNDPANSITCPATASMTATTQTSLCAAAGSGLKNYVTQVLCGNAHATVDTFVDVEDGSGGTILAAIPAAHAYGGAAVYFNPPLKSTTNTAIFVVNETTGAATKCSATGFKGP